MSKILTKRLIWLMLLIVGSALALTLMKETGLLIAYFDEGADPSSALNIVPNVPLDLYVSLNWSPDDPDTGRKMDDFNRQQIETAYLRAWLQINLSFVKGAPYGLKTYFDGPAEGDLNDELHSQAAQGLQIDQVDTSHILNLHFYSADGSIVSFTDTRANVVHIIRNKAGKVIFSGETQSTYNVVMLLEDGNWRVRHLLRVSDDTQQKIPDIKTPSGFVGRSGTNLTMNGQPYRMAGINYYPQNTPWDKFWPDYNGKVINQDFSRIQALGLNTIRVFIPFDQFGGPSLGSNKEGPPPVIIPGSKPTASTSKTVVQILAKFDDLLEQAKNHNLHVIATLFDFHTDYTLLHWPQSDTHLEALLTRYQDNPTILAWDIKNEPDLDYKAAGQDLVNIWLAHTVRLARLYDQHHLITIGWSSSGAAQQSIPLMDLISFHYYNPASNLPKEYTNIKETHPNLPIAMTEFNLPTWNSPFFPGGHTEDEQANYYADILSYLRRARSAGYLSWTLYDFTYIPKSVGGSIPWQSGPQRNMGVIKSNGQLKAAAHLLKPGAGLNLPQQPYWKRYLKPFWFTFIIILTTLFMGSLNVGLRIRRSLKAKTLPSIVIAQAVKESNPFSPADIEDKQKSESICDQNGFSSEVAEPMPEKGTRVAGKVIIKRDQLKQLTAKKPLLLTTAIVGLTITFSKIIHNLTKKKDEQ